jgi:DNA-binding MarR family transcriptional regulator
VDEEAQLREALGHSPLMRLVSLAGHVTSQRFGRLMSRQHGLSSSGAAVLTVLGWDSADGRDGCTPGRATHADLARRMWLAPATLTGIVDTLEKAGYVRRERDGADRRVVWLVLTEDGRDRVKAIERGARDLFHGTISGCDPAHEKVIREFLIDVIVTYHEREETDG